MLKPNEQKKTNRSKAPKPGRIAKKAANITVDMVSATVSTVLRQWGRCCSSSP